ncbi:MAG: hypothetical protein ACRDLM_12255 [Gaiellaceae bacterium]
MVAAGRAAYAEQDNRATAPSAEPVQARPAAVVLSAEDDAAEDDDESSTDDDEVAVEDNSERATKRTRVRVRKADEDAGPAGNTD